MEWNHVWTTLCDIAMAVVLSNPGGVESGPQSAQA